MTTNRIKIASGSSSPFRVSASGVDVNGATFNGLIFDGNQKPLRVYSYGYVSAAVANPYGIAMTAGPLGPSTPSGTYPLFTIAWRARGPDTGTAYPLRTVGPYAGGTFNSNNQFSALTFRASGSVSGAYPDTLVNYLIFRNAG